MNAKLLSLLTLISFTFAQGPSGTSTFAASAPTTTLSVTQTGETADPSVTGVPGAGNIPPCIQNCIPTAASQAGCNPSEISCLCSDAFMQAALTCGQSCPPEEQQAGLTIQQETCSGASGSFSGSGTSTFPGSFSGTSTFPSGTGVTTPSGRPTTFGSGSSSRPFSTTTGRPSGTGNAAVPDAAADSLWALGAGILGLAVAL